MVCRLRGGSHHGRVNRANSCGARNLNLPITSARPGGAHTLHGMRLGLLLLLPSCLLTAAALSGLRITPAAPNAPLLLLRGGAIASANNSVIVEPNASTTASTNSSSIVVTTDAPTAAPILRKALRRALGGGIGGLLAGVVQVLTLMWLRTAMNYQYRHGGTTAEAMRALYAQGGLARFYQGVGWALVQTPLTRFGDTAANSGVLELLSGTALPISVRTFVAGVAAALWRMALTPVDTLKTTLQVEGATAYTLLVTKVAEHGLGTLYAGCAATWLASLVGGYPWFATFNALDARVPRPPREKVALRLSRSALLGVCATGVSDCVANSLRVLKTTRQTSAVAISYIEAVRLVVAKDGWVGLFARGLGTRLLTNALQASLFTIVWKLIEETIAARQGEQTAKQPTTAKQR